jgi:hypothetical protein
VVLLVVVAAAAVAPQGYSFLSSSSNPSSSTQQPGSTGTPNRKAQPNPNTERGSRTSSASSTTATHAAEPHGSNSSHGVWHEGGVDATAEQLEQRPEGYVPCEGPPLQCAVVHKQPVPEVRVLTDTGGKCRAVHC